MPGTGENGRTWIDDIDKLVHEPTRLLLLAHLYVVDSADFVFLCRQTGLTGGNLSSHMTKLETAGYVEVEKSFHGKRPRTVFRLTDDGRAAVRKYRKAMTDVLAALPE